MSTDVVQVRKLRTPDELLARLSELGLHLDVDAEVDPGGALAQPLAVGAHLVGNRFAIHPMEGWDATTDGRPTDLVHRRWERFGRSGAKLIWGGEAFAVRPEARANPRQLCLGPHSVDDLAALRRTLLDAHEADHGATDDLLLGLQLTHSGRWSRPHGDPMPRTARRHTVLDTRVPVTDATLLTEAELDHLVDDFVAAAVVAREAGFSFVDVKHCHGYLLHELLGATDRGDAYGADPTRFLRRVVEGVHARAPGLGIAVRVSAYDPGPYRAGPDGVGEPEPGAEPLPTLDATHAFLDTCTELGVRLVSVTAGSPYYNPHLQRPAYFPPSDGYLPPHDPLVDVVAMLDAAAEITAAHPELVIVGTGYTYLQEWLAHVAQRQVADGRVHVVGYGRMVLSYPHLAADVLTGRPLDRRLLCRTFSDCTTGPRNGLVSGCYPLDPFYKDHPDRVELTRAKRAAESARGGRRRRSTS